MKHIISYSGGIGSAITAFNLVKEYGKDNVILLFADTKMEDEDLYRFNEDIKKLLDCEFITISDGRTVWEVFEDVKFIGNSRIDPCSKILKRDLIKKWIKNNFTPEECIIYVGIDCTEEHRLIPVQINNQPYQYKSWLIDNNIFLTNFEKNKFCEDNNIELPRLYRFGFAHNNCGGFCVKAGLGQFKKLYDFLPDVYLYHENKKQELISKNPKLRPFLQKTIKGVKYYLTLKEYREKYLINNDLTDDERLEFGGCGCAL